MTSIPATPSGSSTTANRTQYHHFIPRLILRGFRQNSNNSITTTLTRKQKKKLKNSNKDGVLQFIQTSDGTLGTSLLSTHYGLEDMYRDMHAENQYALEEELSKLESKAGEVLAKARKTFVQPGASLTLSRSEKDILRRFLFMMKYRSMTFFSKFNVATIDDYNEDDKESLREYMQSHNFRSPKEVWFANMRAFFTIEMDPQREWHEKINVQAYPNHVRLFMFHLEHSYMAFCRPQSAADEFFLTDNAFGIFEGPKSLAMNRITSQPHESWTEWHKFAPISASLLIVLRSNLLPNTGVSRNDYCELMYRMLLATQPSPEQAVSLLEDLPIKPPAASYSNEVHLSPKDLSSNDSFTFQCYDLRSTHVNLIDGIFLEGAVAASTVTYKSDTAAARRIQTYLDDCRPGLKTTFSDDSQHGMSSHIEALGTALQALGGTNVRGQST